MAKFADIPWFVLDEYMNIITHVGELPEYNHYEAEGGYLYRDNNVIVTENTDPLNLYAKNEESGYREIKGNLISNWKDYNLLRFRSVSSKISTPSEDIKREVDENGYHKITYDYFSDDAPTQYEIEPGDQIYSRKDSLLNKWMIDNIDRFENFINYDSPYQYIGEGYKKNNNILEVHYWSMKDWFKSVFPDNNRSKKLDEFIDLIFDRYYHKVYNKQKNLLNLIDPIECEHSVITLLYQFYDEEPFNIDMPELENRLFLDNLIYWLKKRGTYSSLYLIWKILTYRSKNNIIIYDRWHEYLESGSPYNYFEDHVHTDYYAYESEEEVDKTDYIQRIFNDTWNITHNMNTEEIVIHCFDEYYNRMFPKSIDIISNEELTINWEEDLKGYVLLSKPDIIDINTAGEENWEINHGLNDYHLITQAIDENGIYKNPKNVEIIDSNNLLVEGLDINDKLYIIKSDTHTNQAESSDEWLIEHSLSDFGIMIDVYDDNNKKIVPKSIQNIHRHRSLLTFDHPISGSAGTKSIGDRYHVYHNMILSTHYRVEFELNTNPLQENYIISKDMAYALVEKWESSRPVTRVSHYNMLFNPKTDFTGKEIQLYNWPVFNANAYTSSTFASRLLENTVIHVQSSSSMEWNVVHDLDTWDVIVQAYDLDLNRIFPSDIELTTKDSLKVRFDSPVMGNIFVLKGDRVYTQESDLSEWTIMHLMNQKYIFSQFYKEGEEVNKYNVYTQSDASDTWNITHSLESLHIIVQVINDDYEIISPKKIEVIDINNITIEFDEPIIGKAFIHQGMEVHYRGETTNHWIIEQSTGNQYPISQFHGFDNVIYEPSISVTYPNIMDIFGNDLVGKVVLSTADNWFVHSEAADIWTVNHNMDIREVLVEIYDNFNNRIYPTRIFCQNNNTCIVEFNEPISGIASIKAMREIGLQENETVQIPERVFQLDENTIEVFMGDNIRGKNVLAEKTYKYIQEEPADTWNINHGLTVIGVMIEVYDENDDKILPSSVTCYDTHNVIITFDEPITGTAVLRSIGNPQMSTIYDEFDGEWVIKIGNGDNLNEWNYVAENDLKNTIYEISKYGNEFETTEEKHIFPFVIPKEFEGYVTEMGIFNINGDLAIYSFFNKMYNHYEVYTNASVELYKEDL